jgi:hypothetical protein
VVCIHEYLLGWDGWSTSDWWRALSVPTGDVPDFLSGLHAFTRGYYPARDRADLQQLVDRIRAAKWVPSEALRFAVCGWIALFWDGTSSPEVLSWCEAHTESSIVASVLRQLCPASLDARSFVDAAVDAAQKNKRESLLYDMSFLLHYPENTSAGQMLTDLVSFARSNRADLWRLLRLRPSQNSLTELLSFAVDLLQTRTSDPERFEQLFTRLTRLVTHRVWTHAKSYSLTGSIWRRALEHVGRTGVDFTVAYLVATSTLGRPHEHAALVEYHTLYSDKYVEDEAFFQYLQDTPLVSFANWKMARGHEPFGE